MEKDRILVVDDEEIIRQLLVRTFKVTVVIMARPPEVSSLRGREVPEACLSGRQAISFLDCFVAIAPRNDSREFF